MIKISKQNSWNNLNKTLASFLEIEDAENRKMCIIDELKCCNEHFEKTHFRRTDGRYVVEIPFKPELSEIMKGNFKEIASKRLVYLWKRLEHDPTVKNLYKISYWIWTFELHGKYGGN